jgi:hypothetical protein
MPNDSMMFPASNPQLAEMGREANLRVFSISAGCVGAAAHVADGIAVVWASALDEQPLNRAFIFNSAWKPQREDVRHKSRSTRFKGNCNDQ